MEVILKENIPGVGFKGDLKKVKTGYFRNYLFPNGLAVMATKGAMEKYEGMKDQILKEKEELLAKASETITKLEGLTLVFKERVSDKGTLYGSVTEEHVLASLKDDHKMELDKSVLAIDGGHIKEAGIFTATVRLTEEHKSSLTIVVNGVDEDGNVVIDAQAEKAAAEQAAADAEAELAAIAKAKAEAEAAEKAAEGEESAVSEESLDDVVETKEEASSESEA